MLQLDARLQPIIRRVAELTEKCDEMYSACVKANAWNGDVAKRLEYTLQDCISLSDKDKEYWVEISKIEKTKFPINHYKAYVLLAKLYEKQHNHQKAIAACKEAISKGYTNDGTKGGMRGRIERLEKKINSSH